jgi:putative DNA modification/repair radical SAM protein
MTAAAADKLVLLSTAARFDLCATCGPASQVDAGDIFAHAITRLFHPDGSCFSVFKVLMTDVCQYDCLYCANRAGRSCRRHSFAPDELAATFVDLHERGLVTGLFLSSGVKGSPADAMGDMLTAVEILREKHRFSGYVHLKVLPGAPYDCVERAVELADRVSVNVEAPSQRALDHLATRKRLSEDIIQRMHWIRRASERAGPDALKAGQTTQFVVGPAGESDREILTSVVGLRRSVGLRRASFSAFSPVPGTPLEGEPAAPPLRQHRLYQADWLLREYEFELGDICFDENGRLSLDMDPKIAFALRNPHLFPMEVNRATREELLKVPGVGPRSAGRILAARRRRRITSVSELRGIGAAVRRAAPFLLCDGQRVGRISDLFRERRVPPEQLELALGTSSRAAARGFFVRQAEPRGQSNHGTRMRGTAGG